jgi:hypothetical protein
MRSTLPDKRVPPVPANRRHQGGDIFGQILRDILGGGAGDQVQVPRLGVGAAVFGDRLEAGRNVEQSQLDSFEQVFDRFLAPPAAECNSVR